MEVKESSTPHPPDQLWHQEGAQQLAKAEPRRSLHGDAALATDHAPPPFLGKRSPVYAYFTFARSTSTSSHRRPPYGEFLQPRVRGPL